MLFQSDYKTTEHKLLNLSQRCFQSAAATVIGNSLTIQFLQIDQITLLFLTTSSVSGSLLSSIIKYCSYMPCLVCQSETLNLEMIVWVCFQSMGSKRDKVSNYKFLVLVLPSFGDMNLVKSNLCLKRIQQKLSSI